MRSKQTGLGLNPTHTGSVSVRLTLAGLPLAGCSGRDQLTYFIFHRTTISTQTWSINRHNIALLSLETRSYKNRHGYLNRALHRNHNSSFCFCHKCKEAHSVSRTQEQPQIGLPGMQYNPALRCKTSTKNVLEYLFALILNTLLYVYQNRVNTFVPAMFIT